MGTKGSYSGSGGPIADSLLDGLDDWLSSLPSADAVPVQVPVPSSAQPRPNAASALSTGEKAVLPTIGLFRAVSGGASGGGSRDRSRDRGQSARSIATSSGAAGRGAAAAYAYRTGDADTLRDLGLDYDRLRAHDNIFDVVNEIAQTVCSDLPAGTIEGDELLIVVGDLAEWVITTDNGGAPPPPETIAQEAVAKVMAAAYLVQTANKLNQSNMTARQRADFESDIRLACEELASRADFSGAGSTTAQFTAAVQAGLQFLAAIYEGGTND